MRYLERSILLQVIDNRWREHLFDMDYLREGIHLRGFAQIDPLVAYKNEGFVDVRGADALDLGGVQQTGLPRRGRTRARHRPSGLRPQRRERSRPRSTTPAAPSRASPRRCSRWPRRSARGSEGGRRRRRAQAAATARAEVVETVVKDEHDKVGRNDPCWCGSRQEVQEVPRRVRGHPGRGSTNFFDDVGGVRGREKYKTFTPTGMAFVIHDPVASSSGRSTSATWMRSSRSSIPRSSCTRCRGLRKGSEAARLWATRAPGWGAADDRAGGALRGRTEGGGGGVALIMRRWHWDEDGSPAGEDEMAWLFELREHRIRSWRPFEDRRGSARAASHDGAG